MDRFCLEYGKRCIMWDDKDNGFFLVRCSGLPLLGLASRRGVSRLRC